jgi:phosphatidylglycerophosphatase A
MNTATVTAPIRPTARFMGAHPAHWLALGFGSGLSPVAPGTAGTLWAWLAWWVLGLWLTPAQLGWLLVAALPLAWWACTVTAATCARPTRRHRDRRGGGLLAGAVAADAGRLLGQAVAFALFRFFDAAKPGRWAGPTACCTAAAAGGRLWHPAGRPGGRLLHAAGDRAVARGPDA